MSLSLKLKSWWQRLPEHICITVKMFFVLLVGLSTACGATYFAFFAIFGNMLRPGLQFNAGKMLSRMQGDGSLNGDLPLDNMLNDGDVQKFTSPDGQEQFLLRGNTNRELIGAFIDRTQSDLQWTILLLLVATTLIITVLATIVVYFSVKRSIISIKKEHEKAVDLVHNISHDLRTPLSSIQGWANLLRIKTSVNSENQDVMEKIEKIEQSAKRMNELIDDMLLISESAELKLGNESTTPPKNNQNTKQTKTNLAHLTTQIVSDFNSAHNSHTIRFTPPEQNIIIRDNFGKTSQYLQRIIENLLQNIQKHTPKNTEAEVIIKGYKSDKILVLEVRDFGPGVDLSQHDNIFNRFTKVDNSRNTDGNGLGLAIVKELTNELGGTVRSRATNPVTGTGLTVTIMLPIK